MKNKNILEIKILGKEIFLFILMFISGLLIYYWLMRKTNMATSSFMFFSEYCLTFFAGIMGVINDFLYNTIKYICFYFLINI